MIATRAANGSLVIAAWNLVDPGRQGATRTMDLVFRGVPSDARVSIQTVDQENGNVLTKYKAMGSPLDPTPAQVEELNRETALPAPQQTHLAGGRLKLTLTPDALDLVTVETR